LREQLQIIPEQKLQDEVWRIKEIASNHGLDFFDVNFEVITKKAMVEFGTYGLPSRFSHWTFGREYSRLKKFHDLGVMEILEMVINSDPSVAFLLDSNTLWQSQMVIAHVFAHVDFFKNNMWFGKTNRNILDTSHFWEQRVAELGYQHGKKVIESFLDKILSFQWHVDFYDQFRGPRGVVKVLPRVDFSSYGLDDPRPEKQDIVSPKEEVDLLRFLMSEAGLTSWQKELISMVREESLYFLPQAATKIMNEGWATYWHAKIMHEILDFGDFDEFAVQQSQLMASVGLNPYKVGFLIYASLEKHWDETQGVGEGLKKIFEVRKFEDDVSFIRNYLTQDICEEAGLFLWERNPSGEVLVTSTDVEDIRLSILAELTNFGKPKIVVVDGDYLHRKELLLRHKLDELSRELDTNFAQDVLKNIYELWGRPVHLQTLLAGDEVIHTFDDQGKHTHGLKEIPEDVIA